MTMSFVRKSRLLELNQRPSDYNNNHYSRTLYIALDSIRKSKIPTELRRVKKNSSGRFRSYDLWVMGPTRFHCATLLYFCFCFILFYFICPKLIGRLGISNFLESQMSFHQYNGLFPSPILL